MDAAYYPYIRVTEKNRGDTKGEERGKEEETERKRDGRGGQERKRKMERVSTYFVVNCGPRDRLCSQSGTPRSMLSVQGQRTGRAKTRVGTRIRRVHSIQR